jgi:hypothetical protein
MLALSVLIAVVLAFMGDTGVAGPTNLPSWLPVAAPAFAACWLALYLFVLRDEL